MPLLLLHKHVVVKTTTQSSVSRKPTMRPLASWALPFNVRASPDALCTSSARVLNLDPQA